MFYWAAFSGLGDAKSWGKNLAANADLLICLCEKNICFLWHELSELNVFIYSSYVTLDQKNSHTGLFFLLIFIHHICYIKAEWISFPLMYGLLGYDNIWPRYNYLKIWNQRVQKNLNIEKIAFKVVQIKFLAMHINQKLSFDIFTVENLQNILMEHDHYLIS